MGNRNIILEWIPSAYKEVPKANKKGEVKMPAVKTTLYAGKAIDARQGFKRKFNK